ncbi:hypothetical protein [Microbulbifer taiwanensis]|uniref:Glycosyltransferase n=1 Tax=Microbulbifer taiwanensis TaxID=986746 RepID=A0ABW1YPZ4_9GAMM|nr:hypothetical protein [Microbulbifer taiwanensis]
MSKSNIIGVVDSFEKGELSGWCHTGRENINLVLAIEGQPFTEVKVLPPREDVIAHLDSKGLDPKYALSFNFSIDANFCGSKQIKLYAITDDRSYLVTSKEMTINCTAPEKLSALSAAADIAHDADSVGIVVWDGTHNPIGRAKVLYDIISPYRKAVIIAFNFQFSDKSLWEPMITSGIPVVTIPWAMRDSYASAFKDLNIAFNTIWACKPRYPTFELVKMVSHSESKIILDIDDSERALSASEAAKFKPYGRLFNLEAEKILSEINAISVASKSIQDHFGGELVRHARKSHHSSVRSRKFPPEKITIGFFGTVRPHKNLVGAAKAIKRLSQSTEYDVELLVGGHFIPNALRQEIENAGATTTGSIDADSLVSKLSDVDVVITGFPEPGENENEITEFQISSKIGDALSVNRPVLVPFGASVSDLDGVPGVFIFNKENFEEKLNQAISYREEIELGQFSLEENYKAFEKLENIAKKDAVEGCLSSLKNNGVVRRDELVPSLVLIWKQHDSGMYGRRVDQLARTYKRKYPSHRVIILEMMSTDQYKSYRGERDLCSADSNLILDRYEQKLNGFVRAGVEHITIPVDGSKPIKEKLDGFLLKNRLHASNSTFVIYPLISSYMHVLKCLRGYRIISDVVDNQLSWAKSNQKNILAQYKSILSCSDKIYFNSEVNKNFFIENHIVDPWAVGKLSVVQNWYDIPEDVTLENQKPLDEIKVFYSGNMNDRIDWDLVRKLSEVAQENVTIYMIGSCKRAYDQLHDICTRKNIRYLGVLDEYDLINFAKTCAFAIMPHVEDDVSSYMNPLKIEMYETLGIKCIASSVPGINSRLKNITVCASRDSFVEKFVEYTESIDRVGKVSFNSILSKLNRKTRLRKDVLQFVKGIRALNAEA